MYCRHCHFCILKMNWNWYEYCLGNEKVAALLRSMLHSYEASLHFKIPIILPSDNVQQVLKRWSLRTIPTEENHENKGNLYAESNSFLNLLPAWTPSTQFAVLVRFFLFFYLIYTRATCDHSSSQGGTQSICVWTPDCNKLTRSGPVCWR